MDSKAKNQIITEAKWFAKLFSVDVAIKIYGKTIWEFHFPPKSVEDA